MSIPNYLTIFRIVLIPIFMLVFYLPFSWSHLVTAVIFALACVTDLLDGLLARMLKQTSKLGEFLDPVADKLIVAIALVMMVGEKGLPYLAIPAAIIIGREIAISALREWMAELGKRTSVAVSFVGKLKTAIQMIALILLLAYNPSVDSWMGLVGYILIYIAAALTLWSMLMYLKAATLELLPDKQMLPPN